MSHPTSQPEPDEPPSGDPAPGDGTERQHMFDDPRNVKRLLRFFFAGCALLFLVDAVPLVVSHDSPLAYKNHTHYAAENWMGFYAIYGLVGCVVLVLLAKVLRKIVMRSEDYYGD